MSTPRFSHSSFTGPAFAALRSSRSTFHPLQRRSGVAIVLMLAFLVLLSGVVLAFFSRAMSERQISNSSANQTKAEILAQGAADQIIGDLKEEIAAGSVGTTITSGTVSSTIFTPGATTQNPNQPFIPALVVSTGTGGMQNLLKVSNYTQPFFPSTSNYNFANNTVTSGGTSTVIYPASNRAANVSTTSASQNGRYISPARWNKPLLIPATSTINYTPLLSSGAFTAPDWILVGRDGSNPAAVTTSPAATNYVLGRYAYNIYDEGGLLDMNVAGYPSTATASQYSYKNALAYADLTQLGLTQTQIDQIVGWRNYASAAINNATSTVTALPGSFPSYNWSPTNAINYYNFLLSNPTGFLKTASSQVIGGPPGQTDKMFSSRQQLIKFLLNGIANTNATVTALQYLTHFSRDINQPSYIPAVQTSAAAPVVLAANLGGNSAFGGDTLINPSFPNVRVLATFPRNDPVLTGAAAPQAAIGEPLVNKRFALNRLAWVTCYGPIALSGSTYNTAVPAAVITALKNDGLTDNFLWQGTDANIQKYFGLTWANNRWNYDLHRGTSGSNRIIMLVGRPPSVTTADATTYVQDANREPDFFELLKAGITVGSLGKVSASSATSVLQSPGAGPQGYSTAQIPVNLRYNFDSSVDYHVIQIGANILSEVNPTSYPIRIAFDDGSGRGAGLPLGPAWEFQGVTDLPYLHYVFNGVLRQKAPIPSHPLGGNQAVDGSPHQYPTAQTVTLTDSGNAYMIQVPAVWNPYDPNGTPGVLRPAKFRVVIDSNDPLSPSGSGDLPLCHFASATKSTGAGNNGKQGLGPPNAKYSIESDVTVGKSTEQLNGGPGTALYDAVAFDDSNGALYREPTIIFSTTAPGNATRVGALTNPITGNATPGSVNITSIDNNPLPNYPAGVSDPAGTEFAPLVLGQFPLAFATGTDPTMTTYYTGSGYIALSQGNGDNRVYFTYRLQYQDPNNASNWITYDTKYGRTTHGLFNFQSGWHTAGPAFSPSVVTASDPSGFNTYSWASAIDPRTARFGFITATYNGGTSRAWGGAPAAGGWIYDSGGATTAVGITNPLRQDNSSGFRVVNFPFVNLDDGNVPDSTKNFDKGQGMLSMGSQSTKDIPFPSFSAGWTSPVYPVNEGHGESDVWMFAPGLYAQNNPAVPAYAGSNKNGTVIEPSYYADADGVVRRATGAHVPNSTDVSSPVPVGLPTSSIYGFSGKDASLVTPATATPFSQTQSRPLLLHRPFRTVAELGYVFRDLPWKNLDFFTPESGDAGLLDIFCINETSDPNGLVAGKVNLNTRQASVIAAIVAGAYVDDPKITDTTVGSLATTLANSIAIALAARTADTTASYGPLQNVSELVGKWNPATVVTPVAMAATACTPPTGVSYSPSNSGNNWGIDLPLASGYKDGQLSYTGFSGNATAITSGKDLNAVFTPASSGSIMESLANVQRFHEAPIRALASVGQTRVWNLMIDVVAQTGRYPSSATTLANFVVEGEQRYWVHVAIDRLTGQVIDKQVEVVKE